jgi:hypothetical protein
VSVVRGGPSSPGRSGVDLLDAALSSNVPAPRAATRARRGEAPERPRGAGRRAVEPGPDTALAVRNTGGRGLGQGRMGATAARCQSHIRRRCAGGVAFQPAEGEARCPLRLRRSVRTRLPTPPRLTPGAPMRRGRSSRLPVAGGPAPQRPLLSPSSMHTDISSMRKSRVASFQVRMSSIRPLCAVDVGGVARTDCGRNAVAAPARGRICGSTGRAWPNHAPRGGSDVPPAGREPSMATPQGSRGFGHR